MGASNQICNNYHFKLIFLQELGAKCHKVELQNAKLQRKLADKTKENLDRIALNPNAVSG